MVLKLQHQPTSNLQAKDLCLGIKGSAVYQSGSDASRKYLRKGKEIIGFYVLFINTCSFELKTDSWTENVNCQLFQVSVGYEISLLSFHIVVPFFLVALKTAV